MISEEELIKNYFEAKKMLERYQEQLGVAMGDVRIPNVHFLDDLDDRSTILGLEFQIDRLTKEIEKMETYAYENNIILVEPHKTR